jgi:poly-gamma-glutamate capsule biosynthesis protein CapA/YwtB (metallophosphatase superfamily)
MKPDCITIKAVGDVLLGRDVEGTIAAWGIEKASQHLATVLGSADCCFGNLECPLSRRGRADPLAETSFRSDPENARILAEAGFRVLSLANNHIHDFGPDAVADTVAALRERGMQCIGVGRTPEEARQGAVVTVTGGATVGFLAYTSSARATSRRQPWVAARLNLGEVVADIARLRKQVDFLVVSWHAGYEMVNRPSPELRRMARAIVEAGADAILGHGPHVLQAIEWIGKAPVFYSLGNFVFDRATVQSKQQSVIGVLRLRRTGPPDVSCEPLWIGTDHFPWLATPAQRQEIDDLLVAMHNDLNRADSAAQYWRAVAGRVLRDQFGMLERVYKKGGIRGVVHALAKIRPRHLVLLAAAFGAKARTPASTAVCRRDGRGSAHGSK